MLRFLSFLFVSSILAPLAAAQPIGPYQRSCDDISIDRMSFAGRDREYLYAVCEDNSGRPIGNMFFNFRRCRGLIQSVGGVLQCSGMPRAVLPRGPYLRSCDSVVLAHGIVGTETLFAQCRTSRGRQRGQSELPLSDCDGSAVINNNGTLACDEADAPDFYPPPGTGYPPPRPAPGPGPGFGNAPEPPRGSYRSTCTDAFVTPGPGRGWTLTARCETRRGGLVDTRLADFGACRGDIGNNDGQLICQAVQRENLGEAPRGSYRSTCRDGQLVRSAGGTIDLIASCQTRSGRFVDATLPNVRNCNGDIGNDDGRLVCQTQPNLGEPPQGSYRGSCRDTRLVPGQGGAVDLTASCQTRDGRFVDAILPNVRGCRGDIGNNDGQLVCTR